MVANDNLISWFRIPATRQVAWTEYEDEYEDEDPIFEAIGYLLSAIGYSLFLRSRLSRPPCPRYNSCISRLSLSSSIRPEATISPC